MEEQKLPDRPQRKRRRYRKKKQLRDIEEYIKKAIAEVLAEGEDLPKSFGVHFDLSVYLGKKKDSFYIKNVKLSDSWFTD